MAISSKPIDQQTLQRVRLEVLNAIPAEWELILLHRWNAKSIDKRGNPRQDGKRPRDKDWTARQYERKAVLATCERENRNVGIRPKPTQLVLDIDPRNGGGEGFPKLVKDFGLNPKQFPRVVTGSGGFHLFMTKPDVPILDTIPNYPGVEFKSKGRQVVAAGSIHPNGKHYRWDSNYPNLRDAPEIPTDLLEAIRRPESSAVTGGGQYSEEQIERALEVLNPEDFRDHAKWLQLMMACHHASAGEGRLPFVNWSTSDPLYADHDDEIGRRWDSLHKEKNDGVTYKTLNMYLANADHADLQVAPDVGDEFDDSDDDTWMEGDSSDDEDDPTSGLTATLASEIKPTPIDWLWPGRFPIGKLSMVAGFPDQGKSQITTNIAATVSTGGEWPNGEGRVEQGAVLILSAEDDAADTIVPRLKAAGADLGQCVIVNSIVRVEGRARVLNLTDDLARLAAVMQGRNVKLVVVDPIGAYMGGRAKGDSFKNSEVRALLTPLSEWAARHNVAVIAISHFNKGGNGRALYRVTDSLAFTAAARAVWLTAEEPETGRKLFLRGKNNLAGDPGGLAYKIEGVEIGDGINAPRIVWDGPVDMTADEALQEGEGRKDGATQSATAFLIRALADGPQPASEIKEAAEQAGHSEATLRRAHIKLGIVSSRKGGVGSKGSWQWALPIDDDLDEAAE